MQRRTLKSMTLAATLVVTGCLPLDALLRPPTVDPGKQAQGATPGPTTAPSGSGGTSSPQPTDGPVINPSPVPTVRPINQQALSAISLGFLVSNNAAGLKGSVFGPSTLVSNNAAGLVSNNAAGLVSNNAAGYRISAVSDIKVVDGFVYLTTPDERLYVNAEKKLFGALTDKDGNFDMPAPAAKDLIVNVLLSGNRRLTALVNTVADDSAEITVNLATTLVTEYLRQKAKDHHFALEEVFANADALALLNEITTLTTALVAKDDVLAKLQPSDLAINNIPVLRHRYVVAFGTGTDKTLSDKWVAFFRAMKSDSTSPDMVYRPLAVTTVDTGTMIPPGNQVLSVAVAPTGATNAGKIYVSHVSPNVTEILELTPGGGSPVSVLKKLRLGDDAYRLPGTLETLPDGKVVLMDTLNQWVTVMDSRTGPPADPYFGFDNFDRWVNPFMLVDVFCGTSGGNCDSSDASVDDIAFDDADPKNMYLVDLNQHAIWKATDVFGRPNYDPLEVFAGTVGEVNEDTTYSNRASLKFNQPTKATFHRRGGTPYLYVADNGDHVMVRINLQDNTVNRVVGQMPAVQYKNIRSDGKKGPRKALCYSPDEEGGLATSAHLRYPQKMLFDSAGRMLLADGDNRLIRIATVYDSEPRVWTIAGRPPVTNDACETVGLPPPFSNEDGEAKLVALGEVSGMALDPEGNLILSDVRSHRVRKLWTSFLK